jgi:hypothetical protein
MRHLSVWTLLLLGLAGSCRATEPLPDVRGLQAVDVPAAVQLTASVMRDSTGTQAVWLTFTNTSAVADTIVYGACSFAAQLRPFGNSAGSPVWDSRPPPDLPCEDIGYLLALPGHGAGTVLVTRIQALGVYVPPPPTGIFQASALLNDRGRAVIVPAGPVDLP